MENGDDWLALDKLYHVLFGFCTTIIFTLLASRTRYAFIRSRSTWFGSIFSMMAGASKEVADEMGYFNSAGASAKDAVADLFGILIAVLALSFSGHLISQWDMDLIIRVKLRGSRWFEIDIFRYKQVINPSTCEGIICQVLLSCCNDGCDNGLLASVTI